MTKPNTNIKVEKAQSELVSPQLNIANLEDRAQVDLEQFIYHLQITNRAPIKFPYPHLLELGPNFIGATGGSGTRLVARIVQQGGLFLGTNRNRSEDSIDLLGYLSIKPILAHLKTPLGPRLYNQLLQKLKVGFQEYLADFDSEQRSQLWGWKMPSSIFILPFLHPHFPQIKCLHLVRDGRDMAYSNNQNQLEALGLTVLNSEELSLSKPLQSITLWSKLNLLAAEYGEKYLPAQYLRIRFEDLCLNPVPTIKQIFNFFGLSGDVRQIAQAEVTYPKSLGRWRNRDSATIAQLNRIGEVALQKFGYLNPRDLSKLNLEISLQPQNSDLYLQEGHYYFERGQAKSAIDSYQKAIKLNPTQPVEVYQNLGAAFVCQNHLPEAINAYQKALDLEPDNVQVYLMLGAIQAQQGNLTEAVKLYKKAIKLEPWHSQFYQSLAEVLKQLGRLEEVVAVCSEGVQFNSSNPKIYCQLAAAQSENGDLLGAIASYQQALRLHPGNSGIYCQLGNVYSRQGNFPEAISCYQKSIQLQPEFVFAYFSWAKVLSQQGNFAEAIALYQQALQINPDLSAIYNHLGNAQAQQEDYEAAISSYRRSLELNPKQFAIYLILGNSLFQIGQREEAIKAYIEALKLQPNNKAVIKKLKNLKQQKIQKSKPTVKNDGG
ncbi:MAG: tetratricopeptide repeat protein [Xenococcus sp. MO_188.B8]|nr:tetratricopeptide repeat protein [Xenococcus sp. MO_188.B8]